jgi:hypothetical protein
MIQHHLFLLWKGVLGAMTGLYEPLERWTAASYRVTQYYRRAQNKCTYHVRMSHGQHQPVRKEKRVSVTYHMWSMQNPIHERISRLHAANILILSAFLELSLSVFRTPDWSLFSWSATPWLICIPYHFFHLPCCMCIHQIDDGLYHRGSCTETKSECPLPDFVQDAFSFLPSFNFLCFAGILYAISGNTQHVARRTWTVS